MREHAKAKVTQLGTEFLDEPLGVRLVPESDYQAMREVVEAARGYMTARHKWSDRPFVETARMLAQSRREMDDALDRLDAITKEKP